ncbi:MAG: hypothetical protein KDE53_18300, partial [Caldilineaceae bacterium]|nr:hypothetical protein [Caldilineaceae bacterium]
MVSETELMRELAVLRSSVAQLERAVRRRYRVTLEAAYDQPFLGQAATLFVTVRDELTQQPVADAPVTFVTSWGTLRTVAQLRGQTGTSVITQTGVDGTARVTLRPEVAQWLHSEQQAVLEAFVHELDATAPSPQAVLPTLQQMVGEYRWEPNLQLRQAVDSYFAAHRHQLVDPVNQRNELAAWATINATISVTVHEVLPVDADGNQHVGEIAGMALQTLHFRNWLAPWLQVYLETLQSEANFLDTLADEGAAGDAGELLGRAYRTIERYVGKQFGRVGEYTGQQVAKRAVQEFLSTTIAKLPTDTQANLFPALKVASRTVTQEGIHVLTALAQTRTDLREELQHDAGGIDRTQFADLVKRLAG